MPHRVYHSVGPADNDGTPLRTEDCAFVEYSCFAFSSVLWLCINDPTHFS
jgi:hypothetical protein